MARTEEARAVVARAAMGKQQRRAALCALGLSSTGSAMGAGAGKALGLGATAATAGATRASCQSGRSVSGGVSQKMEAGSVWVCIFFRIAP